jgi:hypothetical protein
MVDATWKAIAWKRAQITPWSEGSMAVLIRWFDLQTVYILLGSYGLMSQNDSLDIPSSQRVMRRTDHDSEPWKLSSSPHCDSNTLHSPCSRQRTLAVEPTVSNAYARDQSHILYSLPP